MRLDVQFKSLIGGKLFSGIWMRLGEPLDCTVGLSPVEKEGEKKGRLNRKNLSCRAVNSKSFCQADKESVSQSCPSEESKVSAIDLP